jgi:hypothetical protein
MNATTVPPAPSAAHRFADQCRCPLPAVTRRA